MYGRLILIVEQDWSLRRANIQQNPEVGAIKKRTTGAALFLNSISYAD